MTVRWRGRHVFNVLEARQIVGFGVEHRGTAYYVDSTNGSNTNAGTSWATAWASLTYALTRVADWDIVVMAGGDYVEEDLQVTQQGLKIIGEQGHAFNRGPVLFIGEGSAHIMELRAHDIELANLGFYQVAAYGDVVIAERSEIIWRSHIHDCGFSSSGTGTYGIYAGSIGAEAPYTIVERCRFYNLATVGVYANSGQMVVQRCLFSVKASAVGVEDNQNAASRPNRAILDNKFQTTDVVNAIGVKVTRTPSSGQLLIDGNRFVGFADAAHSCDVVGSAKSGLMGHNYHNATVMAVV